MPRHTLSAGVLLAVFFALFARAAQETPVRVVFETELGAITMEIDVARAPITAANFLKYVDGKFYDGGVVNRAVRPDNTTRRDVEIQVIQFQIDPARRREQFAPIPMERTSVTGLRHVNGALSMARSGPDSATASFSIVIGDQSEMDFGGKRNADGQGFAVFGRVVEGFDVVKKIHASPTGQTGAYGTETLAPPIKVVRAYRQSSTVVVIVDTAKGSFEIAVDPARAPRTAANFLRYVDGKLYDGGAFHRAVRPDTETRTDYPIQVVQASRAPGTTGFGAIAMESTATTGLSHVDGAVSMARAGPDTATSDFFVCIGDQATLDFGGKRNADGQGFAVFGRVVSGMDVIKQIQASPVRPKTQSLDPPIKILSVRRK